MGLRNHVLEINLTRNGVCKDYTKMRNTTQNFQKTFSNEEIWSIERLTLILIIDFLKKPIDTCILIKILVGCVYVCVREGKKINQHVQKYI